MYIPLHQYDFCRGIRGKAWFWMLRDAHGKPAPRVGHLVMKERGVSVLDPLPIYSEARSWFDWEVGTVLAPKGLEASEDDDPKFVERFNAFWERNSLNERTAVSKWLAEPSDTQDPDWFEISECVQALALGDDSWLAFRAAYANRWRPAYPKELALHGILVPAGITQWKPMVGEAERVGMFASYGIGAAYKLDARRSTPVPAANRLFVDPSEGAKVAVPFLRALLRFVVQIRTENEGDLDWMTWTDTVFRSLRGPWSSYAASAIRAEQELLLSLHLRIMINGERRLWTTEATRNRFGRWAPVSSSLGIDFSGINSVLLLGHPTRMTTHYATEIDLDTVDITATKFPW
jgi:hypothetical protein